MNAEDGEGAPPPRKRRFAWILPALLALGLLALFLRRGGDGSAILAALRDAAGRPGWLAVGVALFAVSLACGLLRWFALLRALRLPVPFLDALAARFRARGGGAAARLAETALRAWGAVRLCLRHPVAATAAFALSLANFGTVILCWLSLSHAIGAGIALRDMAVVSPLADGIAALPLTPGGAGLRENTLQWLLDSLGVPRAQSTALGLLMFATILLWAAVCAGIMLAGRRGGARGRSPAGS